MTKPATPTEKACSDCKVVKPLDEFFRDSKRPDGHYSWCKACNTIRTDAAKARRASGEAKPPKVKKVRAPKTAADGKPYAPATKPETLSERVTRAQVGKARKDSGIDTSLAEYAAQKADEAKAAIAAEKATKPAGRKPRTAEQKAADAKGARERRAAKKAAAA